MPISMPPRRGAVQRQAGPRRGRLPRWALALVAALPGCAAAQPAPPSAGGGPGLLTVAPPLDETGQRTDAARLAALREGVAAGLRARGFAVAPAGALPRARGPEIRPRLVECAALHAPGAGPCLGTVTVAERGGASRLLFEAVARAAPGPDEGDRLAPLAEAMAAATARGLGHAAPPPPGPGQDITATGAPVRHLGGARFLVGGRLIDLRAIAHAHDPAVDPDVPAATDVTLDDGAPAPAGTAQGGEAVITLYQVDPPLTGLPSREAGVDRGTDFRDPSSLVKAAYTNHVSPVFTADPAPVRVSGHPIGHFTVKVEVPGVPTLLTGMTTIARSDAELVELTLRRQLGIGGVLLTPQPGRLNSAAEVARELALRQRPLRVVDGLHYRATLGGGNAGPEHLFEDGRTVFVRIRLPRRNALDALAVFAEHLARGGHNRFGSLLNRPAKGTGAGCAAFAMAWLQAAGVIPFVTEPAAAPGPPPAEPEALGPGEIWRAVQGRLSIPWEHLGCDERVGAGAVLPARYTVFDLLFHGETAASIRAASEGLSARIRAGYGVVPATLFQLGAFTPLTDLLVLAHRKDPTDRGDYSWSRPGLEVSYWDNSRFAAWVRRVWEKGPRDPRLSLAREGRFHGLEIDATGMARQREPFFAAADRLDLARQAAAGLRPMSCEAVFALGLE